MEGGSRLLHSSVLDLKSLVWCSIRTSFLIYRKSVWGWTEHWPARVIDWLEGGQKYTGHVLLMSYSEGAEMCRKNITWRFWFEQWDLFANALCRTISRLKDTFSSLFWLCSSALCENSNTIPFVALQMLCQVLETKQTLMKSKGNHQAYFSSHLQDKNDL